MLINDSINQSINQSICAFTAGYRANFTFTVTTNSDPSQSTDIKGRTAVHLPWDRSNPPVPERRHATTPT